MLKKLNKILVANRGEIAIRILRAIAELNIRTVAIYTYEDRYSLHRYKADEAYQIGPDDEPLKPYLDIEEIINLAKKKNVHAIHPGYGFLSENVTFARRCEEEGIIFIGPRSEVMDRLGNKIKAKQVAKAARIPIIEESEKKLTNVKTAISEANRIGYPVMTKAAAGGGGRGMRVCHNDEQLTKAFPEARNEALKAFGDETIFLEKYIDSPKHLEIQIMADLHGNMVHLFERDCSVQRRFQKVVEIAPSEGISMEVRQKLYDYALAICKHVNYNNLGTVEFLIDKENNIFFIEVNPRIQVEHTITEEITGIDLVRSQVLIAQGVPLHDDQIFIKSQEDVKCNGFAIQCRITTEDPSQNFKPDYGTVIAYRSAAGFGIRLDIGNCYTGAKISPFFDPMLVKISASGRNLSGAAQRLHRALREFRIRGVKTNIDFLLNVISNKTFREGKATVKFIDSHPKLFKMPQRLDRGTKALRFLAEVTVNGNPSVKSFDRDKTFQTPKVPEFDKYSLYPKGTKNILSDLGREGFCRWLKKEKAIQFTDTTFRDAHQSLLATRVRPFDMFKVAESFAKNCPEVFSMEVWGGATFDVSMRFLYEDPWVRLQKIRKAIPNILLQMLLRGANAVGYKAYPDNLIVKFIEEAAKAGIDIFRIFDSLNWVDGMKVSIKAVRERTESLAEACICYSGNIINPEEKKYTLEYYLDLARQLEDEGAHILAIKDMAGLLTPYAATTLIKALKQVVDIPIHLHTHDTSAIQAATYLKAIEAGVDVIDVALASMSGLTSQPNFNSIAAFMKGQPRQSNVNLEKLNQFSAYWEDVREFYYPFESGLKAGTAEVYEHEIPGGQYSNLRPQAVALGLGDKFEQIKKNFKSANELFGNIVKVTPSSKVVGDLALYMTANGLSKKDVVEKAKSLSFPESVISMMRGELGQPYQGFPQELQKMILKKEKPFTDRPNAHLEPIDFDKGFEAFQGKFPNTNFLEYLSYLLYPKVFEEYYNHYQHFNDVSVIPTVPFLFGMKVNEEILIELAEGKTLIVKLLYVSMPDEEGKRNVHFEMNGQVRIVRVKDNSVQSEKVVNQKAGDNNNEIGSPLQGRIASVLVKKGDLIKSSQPLFVIEAMKMETTVTAPASGKISKIVLPSGAMVEQDDLVVVMEN